MDKNQFQLLLVFGILLLGAGLLMPAEFTETIYRGGDVIDRTYENNFKYPSIVVGAAITVIAFVLRPSDGEE